MLIELEGAHTFYVSTFALRSERSPVADLRPSCFKVTA